MGRTTDVNEEQPEKAKRPMVVKLSGRVTEPSEEQPAKASSPIEVTPSGRTTEVNEEQPEKAELPMVVNPSGKVTGVSKAQPLKAELPMVVRPSGRVTEVRPPHFLKAFSARPLTGYTWPPISTVEGISTATIDVSTADAIASPLSMVYAIPSIVTDCAITWPPQSRNTTITVR